MAGRKLVRILQPTKFCTAPTWAACAFRSKPNGSSPVQPWLRNAVQPHLRAAVNLVIPCSSAGCFAKYIPRCLLPRASRASTISVAWGSPPRGFTSVKSNKSSWTSFLHTDQRAGSAQRCHSAQYKDPDVRALTSTDFCYRPQQPSMIYRYSLETTRNTTQRGAVRFQRIRLVKWAHST